MKFTWEDIGNVLLMGIFAVSAYLIFSAITGLIIFGVWNLLIVHLFAVPHIPYSIAFLVGLLLNFVR